MNSNQFIKLASKALIGLFTVCALKVSLDVLRVQDYRQANAHISLSPDGRYKALRMYVVETRQDTWVHIALALSGYLSNPLFAIADGSTGEILAFYHPPKNWVSNATGGSWECGKQYQGACTGYFFPYFDEVPLPPPWWKQVHAKVAVKIKGLENPGFKKVTVYDQPIPRRHHAEGGVN